MKKNSKNGKKKKIIIIVIAVVVVGAIIAANFLRKNDTALAVQMDEVKRGTIIQTVSASGKIRPVVEVKISAKVSGTITELYVEEGDSVYKGEPLLKLDQERYLAAMERARSGLKSAQASLWKAKAEYERFRELFDKKLASQAELQAVEAAFRLAESDVEQAEAMLKEAKDDLSKTEIFSPMKGVVSQLNKEKGEMVLGASFQEDVIMVVADLSKMEAEVEVDENDVVNVALDDTVKIEIDAFPDTLFKGTVTRIANTGETRGLGTQEEITNFKVEIGILDKIKGIRPGMSATVDIQVEKHDSVLYVPIQCVAMRSPEDTVKAVDKDTTDKKGKKSQKAKKGKSDKTSDMKKEKDRGKSKSEKEKMVEVVFVVDEGDTARIVPIKTGIASDTDIEILTALEEGKKIVSGPYRILATKIRNGDKIKEEKAKKEENQQKRD